MIGSQSIAWDPEASQALKRVPRLVRGLARRKIEQRVQASGRNQVNLADFEQAEARFRAVRGGRNDEELAAVLPAENRPGVPLVVVEACRAQLAGCPNALLDTEPWQKAIEKWLQRDDISERLRQKVGGDQVLFHHKLKIAIAGCANGCSRPQIADLALVGIVRPSFDAELCTACGQCAEVCPDKAIEIADTALWDPELCLGCLKCAEICPEEAVSLSEPRVRVLMGGKLGRHPHLAREVGAVKSPQKAVDLFSQAIEQYLNHGAPGQRFADWWRLHSETEVV